MNKSKTLIFLWILPVVLLYGIAYLFYLAFM